jgi:hypothetical protein
MRQYSAKRDKNEPDIIKALRYAGCSVQQLSIKGATDLLVGYERLHTCSWCKSEWHEPTNGLIEVKMPGEKLTEHQILWHAAWAGQIAIAHTIEEALEAVGKAGL